MSNSSLASRTDHYSGVQFLRFIAAFLVLCAHSTLAIFERIPSSGMSVWGDGAVGVKIFFVISGFVMAITGHALLAHEDGARLFLVRRLVRIVPLYWFTTLLKLAVILVVPSVALHSALDWTHVIASFAFFPYPNAEGELRPLHALGWTLNYEMLFYVLFSAALLIRISPLYLVGAVFSIATALGQIFEFPENSLADFYTSPLLMLFVAGMAIGAGVINGTKLPTPLLWGFMVISVASMATFSEDAHPALRWFFYSGASSALLVGSCVFLESKIRSYLPSGLVSLGDSSYSLYLIHPFIIVAIGISASKIGMTGPWTVFLVMTIASIAISILCYRLVEQPMTRMLRGLTQPKIA